jgi:hypothetical protein
MREIYLYDKFGPVPWTVLLDGKTLEASVQDDVLETGIVIDTRGMDAGSIRSSISSSKIMGVRNFPWLVDVYKQSLNEDYGDDASQDVRQFDAINTMHPSHRLYPQEGYARLSEKGGWSKLPPIRLIRDTSSQLGLVSDRYVRDTRLAKTSVSLGSHSGPNSEYYSEMNLVMDDALLNRDYSERVMRKPRASSRYRISPSRLYQKSMERQQVFGFYMKLPTLTSCGWFSKMDDGYWQMRLERMHVHKFECVECGKSVSGLLTFGQWECGMTFRTKLSCNPSTSEPSSGGSLDSLKHVIKYEKQFEYKVRADHRPSGIKSWLGSDKTAPRSNEYDMLDNTTFDPKEGEPTINSAELERVVNSEVYGDLQTPASSIVSKNGHGIAGSTFATMMGGAGIASNMIPVEVLNLLPEGIKPVKDTVVERDYSGSGSMPVKKELQILRFDVNAVHLLERIAKSVGNAEEFIANLEMYFITEEREDLGTRTLLIPIYDT